MVITRRHGMLAELLECASFSQVRFSVSVIFGIHKYLALFLLPSQISAIASAQAAMKNRASRYRPRRFATGHVVAIGDCFDTTSVEDFLIELREAQVWQHRIAVFQVWLCSYLHSRIRNRRFWSF